MDAAHQTADPPRRPHNSWESARLSHGQPKVLLWSFAHSIVESEGREGRAAAVRWKRSANYLRVTDADYQRAWTRDTALQQPAGEGRRRKWAIPANLLNARLWVKVRPGARGPFRAQWSLLDLNQ